MMGAGETPSHTHEGTRSSALCLRLVNGHSRGLRRVAIRPEGTQAGSVDETLAKR